MKSLPVFCVLFAKLLEAINKTKLMQPNKSIGQCDSQELVCYSTEDLSRPVHHALHKLLVIKFQL